jgi:sugar lactone lactonase YvrE
MNLFAFRNCIKPSHLFTGLIISLLLFLSSFNSSGQIINTIAGDSTSGYNGDNIQSTTAELYDPYGVAVDSVGNVYIADWANNRIRKITISTGIITTIAGTGTPGYNGDGILATTAELNFPRSLALDRFNNVYIADATNGRIRKVNATTGMISTVAGTGTSGYNGDNILATNAQVNDPVGLCVDFNLNIYIADLLNARIRKVNQSNDTIYTVAGNGTAGYNGDYIAPTAAELKGPSGVAVDEIGNIFIADTYNNRIRMVGVSTGLIFTICGTGVAGYSGNNVFASTSQVNGPFGLFEDQAGFLYYADAGNNLIRKIDHSTGLVHNVAGNLQSGYDGDGILATSASLNYPTGVCIAHDGTGYIADSYNERVRVISGFTTDVPVINNSSANSFIYPNPFSTSATFIFDGTENSNSYLYIYNVYGDEVKRLYMGADKQITIYRDNLPGGMYFYNLVSNGKETVAKGKFVVE